jgi:phage N-6-adenine-methyltransferase
VKSSPLLKPGSSQEWETPSELFEALNAEFGFQLDVAASDTNHLCLLYFTKENSALDCGWSQHLSFYGVEPVVWCNPPYGPLAQKFIEKAAIERVLGVTTVMLVPARTDTKAWHQFIWDNKGHHPRTGVEVRFLPGRLKFRLDGKPLGPATFPSAVVVFRGG